MAYEYLPRMIAWRDWIAELIAVAAALVLIVVVATGVSQPLLHVQAPSGNLSRYLSGFGSLEQSEYGIYRWSGARAAFRLFGLEQRAPVIVRARLSARREEGQPPALLTLGGERQLTPVALSPGWRRYALILPAPPRGDEMGVVTLESSTVTFAGDTRTLGFALDWIEARQEPLTLAERLPNASRLLFLVALELLGYALLRRRGYAAPAALGAVLVVALILGVAIARAPTQLAYWLPNLWLLPITGWLALALPPAVRALRRQPGDRWPARAALAALAIAVAQLLLPLQQPRTSILGWTLLIGGCAALVAWLEPTTDHRPPTAGGGEGERGRGGDQPISILSDTSSPLHLVKERFSVLGSRFSVLPMALLACTLVALALRLLDLDGLPLGMWRDEARGGLHTLQILHDPSFRPVYLPATVDIPALLFYLAAVPVGLFGPYPWTIRLAPALAGALTPLALYFMARPLFGARVALVAAGLLAISAWHLSVSRIAFAAALSPPLTLLALGLLVRALQPGTPISRSALAALSGCCAGLALYAYHPSRLTPLAAGLAALLILGRDRQAWRAAMPRLALLAITATLVAWPLISYALAQPEQYQRRLGQTSIFNDESRAWRTPVTLVEHNAHLVLGMWHAHGDANGRHNLPGAPMLDPFSGALFAVGTGLTIAKWHDRRSLLLLAWLALMLTPGVFSVQAPHTMRTVEAIAPTMILAGIGAAALLDLVSDTARASGWRRAVWGIGAVSIAIILALNTWRYFVAWPATPQAYGEFYVADTHIGVAARRLATTPEIAASGYRIYVPAVPHDQDVLKYLTEGLDVGTFEAAQLSAPPGDRALLLAYGDSPEAEREEARRALGPDATLLGRGPPAPTNGLPEFLIYGRGPEAPAAVAQLLATWP